MKKITLFVIVISLMAITSALIAGDKDYPQFKFGGRITMELIYENNMNDYTDFDEDTGAGNDAESYGRARADLNFKTMINDDICAVISTRFENGNGNKWLSFGKNYDSNGNDDGSKMQDTSPKLQEAYIGFKKLFFDGLNAEIGRKAYVYGAGNVMGDLDKVDGWRIGYKSDVFYVNFHYMLREQYPNYAMNETAVQYTIWGLNGGMDNLADMVDLNVYYWLNYMPMQDPDDAKEVVADMHSIFGARGEFSLMDDMLMPYAEFAVQFGANEKAAAGGDDYTYSGYMIDLGADFEKDLGNMAVDANLEIYMASGDDADTADEWEGWNGTGTGNHEVGYNDWNIANVGSAGLMMFNIGGGITPIENFRAGLNFFMFNDNSANYKVNGKEISGENMCNELDIDLSYDLAKKTCLYTTFAFVMPNKDYPGYGEDTAFGWCVGAQTKW